MTSYLSLRPSKIDGVGVFADQDFVKGEPIYVWGPDDSREVKNPIGREKEFCEIYCVPIGSDVYCCPKSFNQMSLGWYLNHSDIPNARITDDYAISLRNISLGEEITIDYSTLEK